MKKDLANKADSLIGKKRKFGRKCSCGANTYIIEVGGIKCVKCKKIHCIPEYTLKKFDGLKDAQEYIDLLERSNLIGLPTEKEKKENARKQMEIMVLWHEAEETEKKKADEERFETIKVWLLENITKYIRDDRLNVTVFCQAMVEELGVSEEYADNAVTTIGLNLQNMLVNLNNKEDTPDRLIV